MNLTLVQPAFSISYTVTSAKATKTTKVFKTKSTCFYRMFCFLACVILTQLHSFPDDNSCQGYACLTKSDCIDMKCEMEPQPPDSIPDLSK